MNKVIIALIVVFSFLLLLSFRSTELMQSDISLADSLRKKYSEPVNKWPKPTIDKGINYVEFGLIANFPVDLKDNYLKQRIELGKILFFDGRLSSSNEISCSSCHQPDLHFTDGLKVSIGHNKAAGTRNSPSLENVAYGNSFFWDGRAKTLEEQALGPISSEIEMHQEMKILPKKLKKIKGYRKLFKAAFGNEKINAERIFKSLADFQRTLISGKSAFDKFLESDKKSLTDQQVIGLNLFRTKARCMNCHYGPLFTDNEFHNLGLSNFGEKNQDLGLYNFTKKPEDAGKFKTPGLRNVMNTGPWFHDGSVNSIEQIMTLYNMGMPFPAFTMAQLDDPLLPKHDKLLRGIRLSQTEINALISFLHAISTKPIIIKQPILP
jgi:cytochrome c peroxidase